MQLRSLWIAPAAAVRIVLPPSLQGEGIEKEQLKVAGSSEDPEGAIIQLLVALKLEEIKANVLGHSKLPGCRIEPLPPVYQQKGVDYSFGPKRRLGFVSRQIAGTPP